MLVIYGKRRFGKVDWVPGQFHIATSFYHAFWFPLVPTQSWVVLDGGEDDEEDEDGNTTFEGIPIGFSPKSIITAWLRAALWVAFGYTFLVGANAASIASGVMQPYKENPYYRTGPVDYAQRAWTYLAIAAGPAAGLIVLSRLKRAGYARAIAIAEAHGLPTAPIDEHFGIPAVVPVPSIPPSAPPGRFQDEDLDLKL